MIAAVLFLWFTFAATFAVARPIDALSAPNVPAKSLASSAAAAAAAAGTCNRVACSAILLGCSGLCLCDVLACSCCAPCIACFGGLWYDCCDCIHMCDAGNDFLLAQDAKAQAEGKE